MTPQQARESLIAAGILDPSGKLAKKYKGKNKKKYSLAGPRSGFASGAGGYTCPRFSYQTRASGGERARREKVETMADLMKEILQKQVAEMIAEAG